MFRYYLRIVLAIAVVGIYATTASAGNLGLVDNGDMELESRFAPHGTPGVDHPNGYADAWHHSSTSAWSDPNVPDPTTSGIHSLWLPDSLISDMAEMRSFAGDSACCGGGGNRTGNIPGVGAAGRVLEVGWEWDWAITSGTVFTATIRISDFAGTGLDLSDDGDPNNITETFVFTDGSPSSGGFVSESVSIPLSASAAQFDIIFNTGDRSLALDSDPGKLDATGVLFVDDVHAALPEPASLLLLSIAGLMAIGRRQRG